MGSFKVYSLISFLITAYAFYHLYQTESQLFGFTLHIINSKVYFCIALNFIVMLTLLIGKILIYIFFEEVRLSELSEVTDKIKVKFFTLFIWIFTTRPSIDISKILLLVTYFFMAFLTFISFKRSSYMISLNEKSKRAQAKIVLIFVFFGILNYTFHYIYQISFDNVNLRNRGEISDWIIYAIVSQEFILLFIMLVARFYKLIINLTSINMGKVWEHRLIVFRLIGLIKYITKLAFEIDFFHKMYVLKALPIYYIFDFLYNFWNLFKLILKIYDNYRTTVLIAKLKDYNFTEEMSKLQLDDVDEETKAKIKGEKQIICSICLSPIETGKYLSCGHVFHLKCIKEWSIVNMNCPIDKSPLIVEENAKAKSLTLQAGGQPNENAPEATDEELLEKINLHKVTKGVYVPKKNPDLIKYSFLKQLKVLIDKTYHVKQSIRKEQSTQPGAIAYALPSEVIYNRGIDNEIKRLEQEILNKRLIDLYKNPYNAMNQYEDLLKRMKNQSD